ncbi:hypothetical protein [Salinactinospora qingdaonensis]|uniref:Uncharacterized protein n=1 Tax=Salinactinospora qingdaonensis TaxID=702744 RepID=A0ABP7GLM0_9ACTN
MTEAAVRIYDIMACNVYWDFESPLQREQHKFLVSFYPTEVATPELIQRIVARGPQGYEVEISNQRFTPSNTDGYIYDRTLNYYWYMLNLPTGYLPEGEYTIEVTCTNGEVLRKSRVQRDAPSQALISAYTEHRDTIVDSFSPAKSEQLPAGTSLENLRCQWSTLRDLGGPDAFYIYRLSQGRSAREFDTQNLTWWDNIFIQRAHGNPEAGHNRGEVTVGAPLRPATPYAYFVEVTDANAQSETNICIFQPHQMFVTP